MPQTKALNRAANRNRSRFPEDFRFQLTRNELENLKCQFGTSNETDGYVDTHTLNILAKKREGIAVAIYTSGKGLTQDDVDTFNAQHPTLSIHRTRAFHDRFLVLDSRTVYHVGASLKDAGRKCFAISRIQDEEMAASLVKRLCEIAN